MAPTAELLALAERRPWLLAPVGRIALPVTGAAGIVDYLLRDTIARAVARGFFRGVAGESLLVGPGELPIAGMLLLGYGEAAPWDDAMTTALAGPPLRLGNHGEVVAVLPPDPVTARWRQPWPQAADRFVPLLAQRLPGVRRWLWPDLEGQRT